MSMPKAYLGWILFDDQMNNVASICGVVQVQSPLEIQTAINISKLPMAIVNKEAWLSSHIVATIARCIGQDSHLADKIIE